MANQVKAIVLGDEKRRHSIDDSIALENDLLTPEPFSAMMAPKAEAKRISASASQGAAQFDPQVVAHIISDLRLQIAQLTKERDGLQESLQESQTLSEELRGSLQALVDKCNALQLTLDDAEAKERDLQDTIANLRNKLEESRRGLMRLQSESRRQSTMTLDASRSGLPFGGSPSARRTSFTPLTGSGTPNLHRRISSLGGSSLYGGVDDIEEPGSQVLTLPNSVGSPMLSSVPRSNRRASGFFGRPNGSPNSSPPQKEIALSTGDKTSRAVSPQPDGASDDAAGAELARIKAELEETRRELSEAREAREASDAVAKALREYISSNSSEDASGSGIEAVKLPPLPTFTTGEETDGRKRSNSASGAKGWGISKLWRVDTITASTTSTSGPLSAISASPDSAPGPAERSIESQQPPTNATSSSHPTASPPTHHQQLGMGRKFGSFWSASRASISSLASVPNPLGGGYATSDTSSIVEPTSPSEGGHGDVDVRVARSSVGSGSGESSPEHTLTTNTGKKAGSLRARLENQGVTAGPSPAPTA